MSYALEQLVLLQQSAGARCGCPKYPASVYKKHLSQALQFVPPEYRAEFARFVPSTLPTEYENPLYYFHLYVVARLLDEHLEKFSSELPNVLSVPQVPKNIVIGTIPIRSVNAMVCQFDATDEVLICFRAGLFEFLDELTHLVLAMMEELESAVSAVPAEAQRWTALAFDQNALDRYLDSHLEVRTAFVQIITQFGVGFASNVKSNIWRSAFPKDSQDTGTKLYMPFMQYLLMFVLGHEYGHLLAGHLSVKKAVLCMVGGMQVENQRHSYQEELNADLIGEGFVKVYLQSIGMQNQEELIVSSFFLTAVDLLQRAIAINYTGHDKNRPWSSHPPPFSRRWKLQTAHTNSLVDEERAAVAATLRSAKMLEFVLESLWMRSMDDIYRELAHYPASPDWAETETDYYPAGVASTPYTLSSRDDASRQEMNRTAECGAFHYGQLRALMFLAPYAVAEGYAIDDDARDLEKSALSALLRFAPPEDAQVLSRQGLRAEEIFELEAKALPDEADIAIAADLGSLVVSASHFPHPAAQRVFSGMARSINAKSLGMAYGIALPDEPRVWRAINELCAVALCGVVPTQRLLSECITIIKEYYRYE